RRGKVQELGRFQGAQGCPRRRGRRDQGRGQLLNRSRSRKIRTARRPLGCETQGAIARLESQSASDERSTAVKLHADRLRTDVLFGPTTTGGSGSRNAAS